MCVYLENYQIQIIYLNFMITEFIGNLKESLVWNCERIYFSKKIKVNSYPNT